MKQKEKEVVVRGMKHSEELGCAIPSHWDVKALGDVAEILYSNIDKKSIEGEIEVLLCNYIDVYYNNAITNKINFMKATASFKEIQKFQLQIDDVLITKDSETPLDIAVPSYVKEIQDNLLCGYHLVLLRSNKNILYGTYLYLYLLSYTAFLYTTKMATGSIRFTLNQKSVQFMPIPLPPVEEQEAIARVLGSADAVLDALAEQHAKAEALKTMLMQQLLSGTRSALDGAPMPMKHSEELGCAIAAHWDVKALGDVADITTGKTPPTENKNNFGNYLPFISPSDLDNVKYIKNSLRKLSIKGSQYIKILPANTVLFTGIGTIGKTGITVNNVATNQQIHALQSIDIEYEYLYYILIFISPVIQLFAQKTAVPQINKTTFSKMPIPLPPVEEQEAIARVLGSADAVIDALAEQRATAETLKTMLMQQLLSGTRSALP